MQLSEIMALLDTTAWSGQAESTMSVIDCLERGVIAPPTAVTGLIVQSGILEVGQTMGVGCKSWIIAGGVSMTYRKSRAQREVAFLEVATRLYAQLED